jgi:hypothetical protein
VLGLTRRKMCLCRRKIFLWRDPRFLRDGGKPVGLNLFTFEYDSSEWIKRYVRLTRLPTRPISKYQPSQCSFGGAAQCHLE